MGLCLAQTGQPRSILEHAACNCFWKITLPQLQKLAADRGVVPPGKTLYEVVTALLQDILSPLDEDRLKAILALRSVVPVDPFSTKDLPDDVLDNLADKEEGEAFQAQHLVTKGLVSNGGHAAVC
eukprot:6679093-Lingulodinium_polyedra.AAC.1